MPDDQGPLAGHVEETVDAIAEVHRDHYRRASLLQRTSDRLTATLGRPGFILGFIVAMAMWAGANMWAAAGGGGRAIDPPPFVGLELFGTMTALVMGLLILATQRREDQLAEQRSQLTLELALLSERKSAKIIALLEELRRDSPTLDNRVDPESVEMSNPADPQSMLAAIKDKATGQEG